MIEMITAVITNFFTFKGFLSTILGMLDSIEEQVNEELNDELSKSSLIPDTSQDNTTENFENMQEDEDEDIDTKANLHLEIGLLEVSDKGMYDSKVLCKKPEENVIS